MDLRPSSRAERRPPGRAASWRILIAAAAISLLAVTAAWGATRAARHHSQHGVRCAPKGHRCKKPRSVRGGRSGGTLRSYIPSEWIDDLKLVAGDSSSIGCPPGFTRDPQDLNQGAGGKYIYLCKHYTTNAARALPPGNVTASDSERASCDAGSSEVRNVNGGRQDLNEGAGGAYEYLCYPFGEQSSVGIREIDFSVWRTQPTMWNRPCLGWSPIYQDYPPSEYHPGWLPLKVSRWFMGRGEGYFGDLNEGAGGRYIYECEFKARK